MGLAAFRKTDMITILPGLLNCKDLGQISKHKAAVLLGSGARESDENMNSTPSFCAWGADLIPSLDFCLSLGKGRAG